MKTCITCIICGETKEWDKFVIDDFDEMLDICRECDEESDCEDDMDDEEREGWNDIVEYYSDR